MQDTPTYFRARIAAAEKRIDALEAALAARPALIGEKGPELVMIPNDSDNPEATDEQR